MHFLMHQDIHLLLFIFVQGVPLLHFLEVNNIHDLSDSKPAATVRPQTTARTRGWAASTPRTPNFATKVPPKCGREESGNSVCPHTHRRRHHAVRTHV